MILEEEDCIIATQAVNELPLCFLQKTYCSKTEKVEKNLLYKFGKGTSTRKVLQEGIPAYIHSTLVEQGFAYT